MKEIILEMVDLEILFNIISEEAGSYLDNKTDEHNLESCLNKFEKMTGKKIFITDSELLQIYMTGFNDELYRLKNKIFTSTLKQRAYTIGRMDAIAGDDVSSVDEQSDEDILKHIKEI